MVLTLGWSPRASGGGKVLLQRIQRHQPSERGAEGSGKPGAAARLPLQLQDCGRSAGLRPAGTAGRQLPAQGPGSGPGDAEECRIHPAQGRSGPDEDFHH